MSATERFQEILTTARAAYGDLEEPNYAFAEKRYRNLRRHPFIGDLMSRYLVRDDTDLNDHVSVHLRVLHAEGSAVVCLSFVGNWAMLFRLASESPMYEDVIGPECYRALPPERDIAMLLRNHGFKLLTKAEAALPISMNLFNTDRDETRVYHAIVADDGVVPKVLLR
ncbi:MAG TPA: hypothetical protein VNA25_07940 [Phycisphaerae bacterium]|nr:hypothetical protein [Phycisphaerae bacterium]